MKTLNPFIKYSLLCIGILFFSAAFAQQEGQDSTKQLYQIVKNDNNTYVGIILSDDGREVLIETEAMGKIYIKKSDIKSIKKVEAQTEIVNGEVSVANSFSTRYSFTTNALPIKKGENYSMINLYGPEVHFALTDHFSLGVMSTWIASPMVLAAKYSMETGNENVNVSLGALMGTSGYINNFGGYGGLYFGNVTLGDRVRNLTLAGGYAFLQPGREADAYQEGFYEGVYNNPSWFYGDDYDIPYISKPEVIKGPIFSVAGIAKVGAKASLVFDAMVGFFAQDEFISKLTETNTGTTVKNTKRTNHYMAIFMMPGMRFQSSDKRAFQISLAGVTFNSKYSDKDNTDQVSFPLPMVTWFKNF